jgi:hypothetical protein
MNTQEMIRDAVVKLIFKKIKGTSFVGIRNYTSKSSGNEVSNQTFLVGVNRTKRLQKDLAKLKGFDLKPVIDKYGKAVAEKAQLELIIALEKVLSSEEEKERLRAEGDSTIRRSDAQKDSYIQLANGLKMLKETEDIYVYGYMVKKTELVEGEKKEVKSQPKTKAKRMIKKLAECDDRHYRSFKVGNRATLKIQGIEMPW